MIRSRFTAAAAGALQFGIEETEIEHGVMGDKLGVAKKSDEIVHFVGEQGLVLEKFAGQAVNFKSLLRHVAFAD